jgi:hypothetical protein
MKLLFIFSLITLSLVSNAQEIKALEIDFMRMAEVTVASSISDSLALGGYAQSKNLPQKNANNLHFNQRGIYLHIDESKTAIYRKQNLGYQLYIVNSSDSLLTLTATDSRLNIVAEAYVDGVWQDIEYLPRVWCGNSYHTVFIESNQFWTYTVPKFEGNLKTKIRYRMLLTRAFNPQSDTVNDGYIYSNEIEVSINPSQLIRKQ